MSGNGIKKLMLLLPQHSSHSYAHSTCAQHPISVYNVTFMHGICTHYFVKLNTMQFLLKIYCLIAWFEINGNSTIQCILSYALVMASPLLSLCNSFACMNKVFQEIYLNH